MTKLTVINGGKGKTFMGKPQVESRVVTLGGHNFLMPPSTDDQRRQVVALFKKSLRNQIEALANSGILQKVVVLELAQQVIDDMDDRLQP